MCSVELDPEEPLLEDSLELLGDVVDSGEETEEAQDREGRTPSVGVGIQRPTARRCVLTTLGISGGASGFLWH